MTSQDHHRPASGGLPFLPPHLTDNAGNVLLVLCSEVRGNLHQHGWLTLTGQQVPLHQHLSVHMAVHGREMSPSPARTYAHAPPHAVQGQALYKAPKPGKAPLAQGLKHTAGRTPAMPEVVGCTAHCSLQEQVEDNVSVFLSPLLGCSALVHPTEAADRNILVVPPATRESHPHTPCVWTNPLAAAVQML